MSGVMGCLGCSECEDPCARLIPLIRRYSRGMFWNSTQYPLMVVKYLMAAM